ncbi:hypothetical protein HOE52_03925 [Candidatus Woesearchaeota archaeon]|jgi:hypothetical protein|nr:hypothetical protein [Candidatus Woesearchaeota archaeon]
MKSNKLFLIFIVLLVALPLALATTATAPKQTDLGKIVSIDGSCTTLLKDQTVTAQILAGGFNVFVDETITNANKKYTLEFTPSQKGTYTVYAACQGETSATTTFCVGTASECGTIAKPAPTPSTGGGSSGGGGSFTKWSYTDWSYCNVSLQQGRIKFDTKKQRKDVQEVRDCAPCDESWTCTASDGDYPWGICQGGTQTRVCTDEHFCGTSVTKPVEQRNCQVEGQRFVSNDPGYTPPLQPEPVLQQPSLWDSWMAWIIGMGSSLLMLILIILIVVVLMKHTHTVFDHKDLVAWIRKERRMGTSDVDIKDILNQNTGWSHEDLEEAFKELQIEDSQSS